MPFGLPDWAQQPEWLIPAIRNAGPFGPMLAGLARGAQVDLADHPDFGVPLLGHYLALPSLASGLLAAGLDDPTSPALADARTRGALSAWRDRTDIPEPVKIASDFVMGLPMGVPLKPLTGALSSAGGRALPVLARAAGPFATPIEKLLAPSSTALVNEAGEGAATLASRLRAAGQHPDDVLSALSELKDRTLDPAAASLALRVGNPTAEAARSFADRVDPEKLLQLWDVLNVPGGVGPTAVASLPKALQPVASGLGSGPDAFFGAFEPMARTAVRGELGVRPQAGWQQAYQTANRALKELLLSGGTSAVQNATDVATKSALAGINPGQVARDVVESGRTGTLAEAATRLGPAGAPAELGLKTSLQGMLGSGPNDLLVNKIGLPRMVGAGALLGALTGNPMTALTGAASGALTHLGANATTKSMQAVETAARLRFLMEGGKRFLAGDPGITGRYAAETAQAQPFLAEIQQLAGPQAGALKQLISDEGSFVTPDRVEQLANGLGIAPGDAGRIGQAWRTVHDLAQSVGTQFSNEYNFAYSRPSNLEAGLKAVSPFPTFALHNLPFYARELGVRNPGLGIGVGNYLHESEAQRTRAGLPGPFFGDVPVWTNPDGGQVWANMLAPISIASQLSPPKMGATVSTGGGLDPLLNILSPVGMTLNPMLETAGQTAGLLDRGKDLPTILPWDRRLAPLGQALTGGSVTDPEAPLRVFPSIVRATVAPDSLPQIAYPEYLVRKQLAEDAFARTGKGWWLSPEYMAAMVDNQNPLHQQAARVVGAREGASSMARAVLPFQEAYASPGELQSDRAMAGLRSAGLVAPEGLLPPTESGNPQAPFVGAIPGLAPPVTAVLRADNPAAFMHYGLQGGPDVARAKYDHFLTLPEAARRAYLALNPDLVQLLSTLNPPAGKGQRLRVEDMVRYDPNPKTIGLGDLLNRQKPSGGPIGLSDLLRH